MGCVWENVCQKNHVAIFLKCQSCKLKGVVLGSATARNAQSLEFSSYLVDIIASHTVSLLSASPDTDYSQNSEQ
jgi:hypothetical protein